MCVCHMFIKVLTYLLTYNRSLVYLYTRMQQYEISKPQNMNRAVPKNAISGTLGCRRRPQMVLYNLPDAIS